MGTQFSVTVFALMWGVPYLTVAQGLSTTVTGALLTASVVAAISAGIVSVLIAVVIGLPFGLLAGLPALGVVAGCAAVAFLLAARGYDPQAGAIRKVKRD